MSEPQVVEPTVEPPVEPPVEPVVEPPVEPPAEPVEPAGKKTISNGKGEEPAKEPDKPYYPEDWRETYAAKIAGDDEKAEKRILKKMKRYIDPPALFSKAWELDAIFSEGGLVKIPGKDAKEDDVAAFNKAMGVPEKAEDYFKDIKLDNGAVIGEADKPLAESFAAAVHKMGATPDVVSAGMNWYFSNMEEQAAVLDESDNKFRVESNQELKDEYGPAFSRYTNSISSLFSTTPGGTDVDAEGSLIGRLLGGRMADGKIIGNDPDMVRFLVSMSRELNPVATVTEGGDQSGMSLEAELKEIQGLRKTNKREYYSEKVQAREQELLDAQAKHRARA